MYCIVKEHTMTNIYKTELVN